MLYRRAVRLLKRIALAFVLALITREMLDRCKRPRRFSLCVTQEPDMSLGNIPAGSTGDFAAALLLNGQPYTPTDSFVLSVSWTADDTLAQLAPSSDSTSVTVTIPGGDTSTSVTITATATAPDGTTVSGAVTVSVTAEPQTFTLSVTQTQ